MPLGPLCRVIEPDGNPTGNASTNWHQLMRYFRGLGSGAASIMGVCFTAQMFTANVRFGSEADNRRLARVRLQSRLSEIPIKPSCYFGIAAP